MDLTRRNIVRTDVKTKFLQIRISEEIKNDLQVVAELRGLSTSALIHSLIVRTIRAEKEHDPRAFQRRESPVLNGVPLAERTKQTIPLRKEEVHTRKKRTG
jgi:hypothetical protein